MKLSYEEKQWKFWMYQIVHPIESDFIFFLSMLKEIKTFLKFLRAIVPKMIKFESW